MLEPDWQSLRPIFKRVLDEVELNQEPLRTEAAKHDLVLEDYLGGHITRLIQEEIDFTFCQDYCWSEISHGVAKSLCDFICFRKSHVSQALVHGVELTDYLADLTIVYLRHHWAEFREIEKWNAEWTKAHQNCGCPLHQCFKAFSNLWSRMRRSVARYIARIRKEDDFERPF